MPTPPLEFAVPALLVPATPPVAPPDAPPAPPPVWARTAPEDSKTRTAAQIIGFEALNIGISFARQPRHGAQVPDRNKIVPESLNLRQLQRCVEFPMSWDKQFRDPIEVPDGDVLASLRDAGAYITRLPKAEHESPEWQTAMHCLIEAADFGGPVAFARLGVAQALNRHVEKVYDPERKDPSWRKSRRA